MTETTRMVGLADTGPPTVGTPITLVTLPPADDNYTFEGNGLMNAPGVVRWLRDSAHGRPKDRLAALDVMANMWPMAPVSSIIVLLMCDDVEYTDTTVIVRKGTKATLVRK